MRTPAYVFDAARTAGACEVGMLMPMPPPMPASAAGARAGARRAAVRRAANSFVGFMGIPSVNPIIFIVFAQKRDSLVISTKKGELPFLGGIFVVE